MFSSERLNYRPLTKDDFELFYELYSNKAVMEYAFLDHFKTPEEARKEFDKAMDISSEHWNEYVATTVEDNRPVGIVDYDILFHNDHGGIAEIGYFIKPEFWGCGYGTEMGKALINYLFHNCKYHKVAASCNANNKSSEKIMKKLGMKPEGVMRKARYKNGEWVDELRYGLLKEEWERERTQ